MTNTTRQLGLFRFVLFAILLVGCASAVDEAGLPPAEEATASDAQALRGLAATDAEAALDADAADCGAAAASEGVQAGSYAEFTSVLETTSVNLDAPELAGSTCTRVCRCCRNNGNRFCCSHCRFCSGPIGVSDGVFAP